MLANVARMMTQLRYLVGRELADAGGGSQFFFERALESGEFDSETPDNKCGSIDELAVALVLDALAGGWSGDRQYGMQIYVQCGGFSPGDDEMGFEFLQGRYVGARACLNFSAQQKELLFYTIDREIKKRVPQRKDGE